MFRIPTVLPMVCQGAMEKQKTGGELQRMNQGKVVGQMDNKGFTLTEVLAACVILTLVLTLLIKGVLAAGNWFAESEAIKNQGEIAANRVEGSENEDVLCSQKEWGNIILRGQEEETIDFTKEKIEKNVYSYGDVRFSTITANGT